jgi:hypothetical protein
MEGEEGTDKLTIGSVCGKREVKFFLFIDLHKVEGMLDDDDSSVPLC